MEQLCIFPGSFDPFTRGHEQIARRAAELFGRVVVLLAKNADKHAFFTDDERLCLARASLKDDPRISVKLWQGMVADAARELGASVIVRGVRDSADLSAEKRYADAMRAFGAPEVVLLCETGEFSFVSSTLVRELIACGGDYAAFLPEGARGEMRRILDKKKAE